MDAEKGGLVKQERGGKVAMRAGLMSLAGHLHARGLAGEARRREGGPGKLPATERGAMAGLSASPALPEEARVAGAHLFQN